MSYIPAPAQALEILKKYNQDAFHLRHGQIVSGVMGCMPSSGKIALPFSSTCWRTILPWLSLVFMSAMFRQFPTMAARSLTFTCFTCFFIYSAGRLVVGTSQIQEISFSCARRLFRKE